MAVLVVGHIVGDPDQLLRALEAIVNPVFEAVAPLHGAISHTVARSENGLVYVDVWEDRGGYLATIADPRVGAALTQAAIDLGPGAEIAEIVAQLP